MEREYSKTKKVHLTLITNRIYGKLMLAQFTKNGIDTTLKRKACVIDLENKLFCPVML